MQFDSTTVRCGQEYRSREVIAIKKIMKIFVFTNLPTNTQNYSRSQNNVNVVYCNYTETNRSYNVIAKRNWPQSLPIVGNIFKKFV